MPILSLKPDRVPWASFPDVVLHAPVPAVKGHREYWAAKSGDAEAAAHLVKATMSQQALATIGAIAIPAQAILVSKNGGNVILAVTLTGKPHSAKLVPDVDRIQNLRRKHGTQIENWWQEEFGFDFSLLTASEARYLESTADADTIRNRIVETKQAGNLRDCEDGVQKLGESTTGKPPGVC